MFQIFQRSYRGKPLISHAGRGKMQFLETRYGPQMPQFLVAKGRSGNVNGNGLLLVVETNKIESGQRVDQCPLLMLDKQTDDPRERNTGSIDCNPSQFPQRLQLGQTSVCHSGSREPQFFQLGQPGQVHESRVGDRQAVEQQTTQGPTIRQRGQPLIVDVRLVQLE